MKSQITLSLYLIILIFVNTACFNSKKKEINIILDDRVKSFELKDIIIYSNTIDNSYNEIIDKKNVDKEAIINNFKVNIAPFDQILFIESDREIHISGNEAKVIIKTSIDLSIKEQKSRYKTTELVKLSKNSGQWKIIKESNLDLFRGFVFGEKIN